MHLRFYVFSECIECYFHQSTRRISTIIIRHLLNGRYKLSTLYIPRHLPEQCSSSPLSDVSGSSTLTQRKALLKIAIQLVILSGISGTLTVRLIETLRYVYQWNPSRTRRTTGYCIENMVHSVGYITYSESTEAEIVECDNQLQIKRHLAPLERLILLLTLDSFSYIVLLY